MFSLSGSKSSQESGWPGGTGAPTDREPSLISRYFSEINKAFITETDEQENNPKRDLVKNSNPQHVSVENRNQNEALDGNRNTKVVSVKSRDSHDSGVSSIGDKNEANNDARGGEHWSNPDEVFTDTEKSMRC